MASKSSGSSREKLSARIFRSYWMRVVTVLAGIVVFTTTYALILPAITLSSQKTNCGVEEHEHTAECYDAEGNPICGLEEHIHTLACYSDPEADIESEEVWNMEVPELTGNRNEDVLAVARSLVNYRESDKNYLVSDENQTQGYTRFGHWYGDYVDSVLLQATNEVAEEILAELQSEVNEYGEPIAEYQSLDTDDVKTLYAEAISARMPAKIAEKMTGVDPSELVNGHVDRLPNHLSTYSYKNWNAMFVSYVLNYAQISDMGFESDAGNWAGALASAGKYIDDPSYIPHAGDLIFFTPDAGSELKVGIVSNVNKNFFGLGKSVKSISVILGDSDNAVEEINVAIDEYQEGDVVFERIHGYGDVTPGDEAPTPDDTSRSDSIVDFITGIISPAPSDEAVSEEAADAQEGMSEETAPNEEQKNPEVPGDAVPADDSVSDVVTGQTGDDSQTEPASVSADESVADAVPVDESVADTAAQYANVEQTDADAVPTDESTADIALQNADNEQSEVAAVPADESVASEEDLQNEQSVPIENIADEPAHIIGATEEDLESVEDNQEAGTVVEVVQADLNEDGTAVNFNWQITSQLPEDILSAGAVIRVDTTTGKMHAMSAVQAKEWAGNARVGGQNVSFAEDDNYEITFIGTNGHLYTWDDVQAMSDVALVEFGGIQVKVLEDVAFEEGNSFVAFGYATTARLAEANIGQNYYVTKASVNGYSGTASYVYENGDPVEVDQDWVLRDANLDETGHAAKDDGGYAGTLTASGKDYTITLSYGPDAGIPEVAKLKAVEIRPGTKEYDDYISEAKKALGIDEDETLDLEGRFFDIKIMTKQGEFTPNAPVRVDIQYSETVADIAKEDVSAVHFAENGVEEVSTEAEIINGEMTGAGFEAESFSVYGIVYRVDSIYDGYSYLMHPDTTAQLEEIFVKLGICKENPFQDATDDEETESSDEQAAHGSDEPHMVSAEDAAEESPKRGMVDLTYAEFSENIKDVESDQDTVKVSGKDSWTISASEEFEGSLLTVTMKDGKKYRIDLTRTGDYGIITAAAGGYSITVDIGDSLPEGNYRVDAVQNEATEEQKREIEYALTEELEDGTTKIARVFDAAVLDISIVDLDSREEVEPDGKVWVTICP